jgi:hypothetical protein
LYHADVSKGSGAYEAADAGGLVVVSAEASGGQWPFGVFPIEPRDDIAL